MKQEFDLGGTWAVKSQDGRFDLQGIVPGTFFYDLERSGHWGEQGVHYRENNRQCLEIANQDFTYSRQFDLPESFLTENEKIFLQADGLDTLSRISLNGHVVGRTDNMFCRFKFEVRQHLQAGTNEIEIHFFNTQEAMSKEQARRPLWNDGNSLDGAVHLRKNHCSFGWDWGPQIPDIGIWKPIRLVGYSHPKEQ